MAAVPLALKFHLTCSPLLYTGIRIGLTLILTRGPFFPELEVYSAYVMSTSLYVTLFVFFFPFFLAMVSPPLKWKPHSSLIERNSSRTCRASGCFHMS